MTRLRRRALTAAGLTAVGVAAMAMPAMAQERNPTVETLKACGPTGKQQATFDDTEVDAYYSADAPQNSVKVAGVGVTATVTADDGQFLTVDVANPAAQPTP